MSQLHAIGLPVCCGVAFVLLVKLPVWLVTPVGPHSFSRNKDLDFAASHTVSWPFCNKYLPHSGAFTVKSPCVRYVSLNLCIYSVDFTIFPVFINSFMIPDGFSVANCPICVPEGSGQRRYDYGYLFIFFHIFFILLLHTHVCFCSCRFFPPDSYLLNKSVCICVWETMTALWIVSWFATMLLQYRSSVEQIWGRTMSLSQNKIFKYFIVCGWEFTLQPQNCRQALKMLHLLCRKKKSPLSMMKSGETKKALQPVLITTDMSCNIFNNSKWCLEVPDADPYHVPDKRTDPWPLVLLPCPCVTHLSGVPLCGLGRPPSDERQTTRWPQSCSHCLQLCHGRPVCIHVPWGVFVLIFNRETKSIMNMALTQIFFFNLWGLPGYANTSFLCVMILAVVLVLYCLSNCMNI